MSALLLAAAALAALVGLVTRRQGALAVAAAAALAALGAAVADRGLGAVEAAVAAAALVLAWELAAAQIDRARRGGPVRIERAVTRGRAAGALALAAAAAAAAGAAALFTTPRTPGLWLPAAVALLAALVAAAAFALARLAGASAMSARPARAALGAFGLLLALGAVTALGSRAEVNGPSRPGPEAEAEAAAGEGDAAPDAAVRRRRSETLTSLDSPGEVALLGVLLVALFLLAGRAGRLAPAAAPDSGDRPPPPGGLGGASLDPATLRREALLAVDDAILALRSDAPPRLAVRLAYAAVASGLGRRELARLPAESEGEYLDRALLELGADAGSLRRLTELFARARFSAEPIDEAMRAEALAAFERIRGEARR